MRPAVMESIQPERLIVLCDGTWCGPETKTRTNVQILAEMIGIDTKDPDKELYDPSRRLRAKYFDGIGLGSTFFAYLFNGSTANDISAMCLEAYAFIAKHFKQDTEVWMFGLSRGAYTVRCVAGMINNCGIVKEPTEDMCNQVYRIYSSPYEEDHPDSEQSAIFRDRASWTDTTPVKFMGLFDTVGSIGIPNLDAGNGPMYPTLWDQIVPPVVDKVYHACSLHDRLSVFQPCLTKVSKKKARIGTGPKIVEQWFPGCHYDLGRQRFKFFRQNATGIEYWLSLFLNSTSVTLEPNHVLSDLVLRFMLQGIQKEYPYQQAIERIDAKINDLNVAITASKRNTGSGDIYEKGLAYLPFGIFLSHFPTPAFVTDAVKVLLAIRDRRIPDDKAIVYPYRLPYNQHSHSIADLAKVTSERYPSRTHQVFEAWSQYFVQTNGKKEANGAKN